MDVAGNSPPREPDRERVVALLENARARTLVLVADLADEQLDVPYLETINPILWELGHVAWFQELWTLRHLRGHPPLRADGDALFDSARVVHATRWSLPLPARGEVLRFMRRVLDEVAATLSALDAREQYFHRLVTFHEDMHGEALLYTRQTLGYAPPALLVNDSAAANETVGAGPCPGDVEIPGGSLRLGAERDAAFVFDNEKWAHAVRVAPFRIARAPVTQAELASFVEDGGYRRRELWSEAGWAWRVAAAAEHPVYWRRGIGGRWQCRRFDAWHPLAEHRPAYHVSWFEAEAYCRWAGRRLPSEAEWEMAAAGEPRSSRKRCFPWGDAPPSEGHALLDGQALVPADVGAFAAGDSAFGCRQMIGNVWEWTASSFEPYPGFVVDPYAEYSAPWFGTHKVLRGGCFATRARLLRNTWRNFYTPDRRDVVAGFRTVAI